MKALDLFSIEQDLELGDAIHAWGFNNIHVLKILPKSTPSHHVTFFFYKSGRYEIVDLTLHQARIKAPQLCFYMQLAGLEQLAIPTLKS
jgi:hypothetical protein